jgi:hypothetical protein
MLSYLTVGLLYVSTDIATGSRMYARRVFVSLVFLADAYNRQMDRSTEISASPSAPVSTAGETVGVNREHVDQTAGE